MTKINLDEELGKVNRVAITGHIRPDGDCTGSTLGVYNYIIDNFKNIEACVYIETPGNEFSYIPHIDLVKNEYDGKTEYDLLIVCDCGAQNRFEPFAGLIEKSKRVLCIDHHVGNSGFADVTVVVEDYSSTCELVYDCMDLDKISQNTAICLFTGLVTDTGSFKYQCVTPKTHMVAANLMEKGINHTSIMDSCMSTHTFAQNQVIGKALSTSRLILENRVIVSYFTKEQMDEYHVIGRDMGVVIDELRTTAGTEVAVFLYEVEKGQFKISFRSRDFIDVSKICRMYGGGGHIKAAGCTIEGNPEEIIQRITLNLLEQFKENQNV